MPLPSSMTSFTAGTTIQSAQVNTNFNNLYTNLVNYVMYIDVARTVTVSHSYTAAQLFADGTLAAPGISNANETGSGFYRIGASHWALALAGTKLIDYAAASITFVGDLLFTDATYDIGKSGATRPRDGFFSRNVTIGGTLATTGLYTASGGITVASGTLTAGAVTISGTVTLSGSSQHIIGSGTVTNIYDAANANVNFGLYDTGILYTRGTSYTGGAVAGSIVGKNAISILYGTNAAANANIALIGTDASDRVLLDGGGAGIRLGGNPGVISWPSANGIALKTSGGTVAFQIYDAGPAFFRGVANTSTAGANDVMVATGAIVRADTGGATAWTTITRANSWAVFGTDTPAYCKDACGTVWLRGAVDGTSASAVTITTLPSGFRPTQRMILFMYNDGGGSNRVIVNTDGTITAASTGATYNGLFLCFGFPTIS